jgi:hypothetical protein
MRLYILFPAGESTDQTDQAVQIMIEPSWVSVLVYGGDAGWVRGRSGGLKDLLADTRTERSIGRGNARALFPIWGGSIGFAGWLALALSNTLGHSAVALILLVIASLAGPAGGSFLLGAWTDRRAKTELRLLPATRARTVDWLNLTVLIATIVLIVIGIVGIIVAHHDATHLPPSGLSYHHGAAKPALGSA